ncbi:hypothetical protein PRIC1_006935 [Phytophthora ramorum]
MHLRYILMMVVATLAASSSIVSAASVSDDVKILSAGQAFRVHENKRFLRTAPHRKQTESEKEAGPVFMEHKLEKALSNPKKTKRLYQSWYTRGITAKEVSHSLAQSENRELNKTYKKLASGYAAYVKEQVTL